jgi:hypothetical protein
VFANQVKARGVFSTELVYWLLRDSYQSIGDTIGQLSCSSPPAVMGCVGNTTAQDKGENNENLDGAHIA